MVNIKFFLIGFVLFFLVGCSTPGTYTLEDPVGINIVETTGIVTIENLWDSCIHNSYGDNCYVVRKFGESANIGTNVVPVTNGEVYQTPMVLTSLDIVSDNVNDVYGGSGAWNVEVTCLSINWTEIKEVVNLTGITPVALSNQCYRVYRMKVYESGTYASQVAGSHAGTIELNGVVGNELWARIAVNGIILGQTEIGVYTIPKGYHAHLGTVFLHNNGNKISNIYMFLRDNASDVTIPYTPMRIQFQVHGVTGGEVLLPKSISGGMVETSDIGFMANTDTGTTEVSVDYEILLIRNDYLDFLFS